MTLDEQIAILQAAKEGKKIRRIPYNRSYAECVINGDGHRFDFVTAHYEIVREPMEIWVNVDGDGIAYGPYYSERTAGHYLTDKLRTVKFREVLDD